MSKLVNIYKNLKNQDADTIYLFKSGIFYIILDEDAKKVSPLLDLKLTKLNDTIVKCGFPVSAYNKYFNILNQSTIKFKIIDKINGLSLTFNDFTIEQSLKNLLNKINQIDTEHLSVSEAYKFIEDIQKDSRKFLNESRTIMKRKSNLYENIYELSNIEQAFNEVCQNTKNKRKVANYKQYKCIYISRIYNTLKNKQYTVRTL